MASGLSRKVVAILISWLCLCTKYLHVSAQCNDYTVVGTDYYDYFTLATGPGDDASCVCDVQVNQIPGCTNPPSQAELDQLTDVQIKVSNVSSRVDLVTTSIETTVLEIEITQDDIDGMTTKLERIEGGDIKVNRPEFELILDEINKLDEVLVLLQADLDTHLETIDDLEVELDNTMQQLFELKKTQDVEIILERINHLETELTQCKANVPTAAPSRSGDDYMFVPWEDTANQDSCAPLTHISSSYTVRQETSSYANGAWMRDPFVDPDKIWHFRYYSSCSSSTAYKYIDRYLSFDGYEREASTESERFDLTSSYCPDGPGLVAYNGSIYYNRYNSRNVYRYDVSSKTNVIYRELSGAGVYGSYAYSGGGCTSIDFAVDENGLWAIYGTATYGINVARLDPTTLETLQTWSVNYAKNSFDNCFIICARLHCIRSGKVSLIFDTVTGETTAPNIEFRSRYGNMYTLNYNPRDQKLYGWNNGKMVLYDLKFGN